MDEAMLLRVHNPFLLWEGCNQAAKSRYNTKLAQFLPRLIYSPYVVDWNVLNQMSCGEAIDEMLTIKLFVACTNEEIFTSEAWTNAFNIDEPIYRSLHPSLIPQAKKKREKTISDVCTLSLVLDLFMMCCINHRTTVHKINHTMSASKRKNFLPDEVLKTLSAPIYYEALDTTTLKELIDSEGRLIPEAPEPGVPRVAITRPSRASMHDLYERMSNMEIRQEPTTHLDMINSSMIGIISSTHRTSSNNNRR
nr:hypothetical protein [Tanacetum cinerariifolium]